MSTGDASTEEAGGVSLSEIRTAVLKDSSDRLRAELSRAQVFVSAEVIKVLDRSVLVELVIELRAFCKTSSAVQVLQSDFRATTDLTKRIGAEVKTPTGLGASVTPAGVSAQIGTQNMLEMFAAFQQQTLLLAQQTAEREAQREEREFQFKRDTAQREEREF
jgi:hypothetical protein